MGNKAVYRASLSLETSASITKANTTARRAARNDLTPEAQAAITAKNTAARKIQRQAHAAADFQHITGVLGPALFSVVVPTSALGEGSVPADGKELPVGQALALLAEPPLEVTSEFPRAVDLTARHIAKAARKAKS